MPRTAGAVSLTKREFESDFYRYCEEHEFSPGYACAQMMALAAQKRDVPKFVALGAMYARIVDNPGENPAQPDLLVVDRRRPLTHERHNPHEAEDTAQELIEANVSRATGTR